MTRVALYARYSDDKQSAASIEDQFRVCQIYADRQDWTVAARYSDAAISGSTVILRPGVKALLHDASEAYLGDTDYIKRYIWYLRQKIEDDPATPEYVMTDRGFGYSFRKD